MIGIAICLGIFISIIFSVISANNEAITYLYNLRSKKRPSPLSNIDNTALKVIFSTIVSIFMYMMLKSVHQIDVWALVLCFGISYATHCIIFDIYYNVVISKEFKSVNIWSLGKPNKINKIWNRISTNQPGLAAFNFGLIIIASSITSLYFLYY